MKALILSVLICVASPYAYSGNMRKADEGSESGNKQSWSDWWSQVKSNLFYTEEKTPEKPKPVKENTGSIDIDKALQETTAQKNQLAEQEKIVDGPEVVTSQNQVYTVDHDESVTDGASHQVASTTAPAEPAPPVALEPPDDYFADKTKQGPLCKKILPIRQVVIRTIIEDPFINKSVQDCSDITSEDLASIKLLHLDHVIDLPADSFSGFTSLEGLSLHDEQIKELPPDIFKDLKSLRSLGLSFNQIKELPPDIFAGLTALQKLNLARNQIEELPPGTFKDLRFLEILDLSFNHISALKPGVFAGLTSLKKLDLSKIDSREDQGLKTLEPGVFDGLTELEELDLSMNEISELKPGAFKDLKSLEILDLSYAFNTELDGTGSAKDILLPNNFFQGLNSLKELIFYENRFQSIKLPNTASQNLTSLIKMPDKYVQNKAFYKRLPITKESEYAQHIKERRNKWLLTPHVICYRKTKHIKGIEKWAYAHDECEKIEIEKEIKRRKSLN